MAHRPLFTEITVAYFSEVSGIKICLHLQINQFWPNQITMQITRLICERKNFNILKKKNQYSWQFQYSWQLAMRRNNEWGHRDHGCSRYHAIEFSGYHLHKHNKATTTKGRTSNWQVGAREANTDVSEIRIKFSTQPRVKRASVLRTVLTTRTRTRRTATGS